MGASTARSACVGGTGVQMQHGVAVTSAQDVLPGEAAATVPSMIDELVERRILVFGSLPPGGRDLDLLVRPREHDAIAAALERSGFVRRRSTWALIGSGSAYAVELVPASRWGLPETETEALFAEALPVPGTRHLVRPAPHQVLLIAALRLVRARGRLQKKSRARVARALAEDADAWDRAVDTATRAGCAGAVALLADTYAKKDPLPAHVLAVKATAVLVGRRHADRMIPRLLRDALPEPALHRTTVSLSGLDGSGKSAQAQLLAQTLDRLGVRVDLQWVPFDSQRSVHLVRRLLRRGRRSSHAVGTGGRTPSPRRAVVPRSVRDDERRRLPRTTWTTFVVVANAAGYWRRTVRVRHRSRVDVYDRYTLDAAVRLVYWYGSAGDRAVRLFELLCPRPTLAYLLAVPPEVALARRDDQWGIEDLRRQATLYERAARRLGAHVLDGQTPVEVLGSRIAADVWTRLR